MFNMVGYGIVIAYYTLYINLHAGILYAANTLYTVVCLETTLRHTKSARCNAVSKERMIGKTYFS